MTDIMAERARLGNGHRAWLTSLSPPWDFVRDMGRAIAVAGEGDRGPLIRKYLSCRNEDLVPVRNKDLCRDIKKYFDETGDDPLDLSPSASCWAWFSNHLLAVLMASSVISGAGLPSDDVVRGTISTGALATNVIYANYNIWANGSQTFVFSQALASKLMLTDVGHLRLEDFRLPFPAFVLQVPPGMGLLVNNETGEHDIDSILVVDGISSDRNSVRKIEFVFTGMENEKSVGLGDDAIVYSNVWDLGEGTLLEDSLNMDVSGVEDREEIVRFSGQSGAQGLRNLLRWACAMILYITDFPEDAIKKNNPEIDRIKSKLPSLKGKAKKNAKRRLRALQNETTPYLVGTNVRIDPRLEKAASQAGKGFGVSPSVASYVRGHRKMQAYGVGRTKRKPIWIDPYWRNLDQEVSSVKTYKVG